MEGNTINSCFFGGGEEPFGCSRILNSPSSSDTAQTLSCLEILFDVLFLCVCVRIAYECAWLGVGMYSTVSVALCICVCLHQNRPLRAPFFRAGAAAEFQAEMPFVIKKNQIEKRVFGSQPDEITFFKQAAVK